MSSKYGNYSRGSKHSNQPTSSEEKMKPFNLTAALDGEPVVTRDGTPVTSLVLFPTKNYPLVGVVKGDREIKTWNASGAYFIGQKTSNFDLFMASEKKVGYINVYKREDSCVPGP